MATLYTGDEDRRVKELMKICDGKLLPRLGEPKTCLTGGQCDCADRYASEIQTDEFYQGLSKDLKLLFTKAWLIGRRSGCCAARALARKRFPAAPVAEDIKQQIEMIDGWLEDLDKYVFYDPELDGPPSPPATA